MLTWGDYYSRPIIVKVPEVDTWTCSKCEGCVEICPEVFRTNYDTGNIEVVDFAEYPADEVNEAIKCCPANCISWTEQ